MLAAGAERRAGYHKTVTPWVQELKAHCAIQEESSRCSPPAVRWRSRLGPAAPVQLEVRGLKTRVLSDSGKRGWADLLAIVERKSEVRPTITHEHAV